MKILITGATGLIGTRLLEQLLLSGYEDIRILTRNKKHTQKTLNLPIEIFEWNPEKNFIENAAMRNVDIVIHLAGENISSGRWSEKKKNQIIDSRTLSTELLLNEIKKSNHIPKKFISSSAVGIYGNSTGDEILTSESPLGNDFLAEVCRVWEQSVTDHNIIGMTSHCLRTGVVLAPNGGALQKMLPPFLLGVGGKVGSGNQYMSWIHIDDLVEQYIFLIKNDGNHTFYNGVAPTPVTNIEFTKALGRILSRPTLFPVPSFVLQMAFGEMAEIILKGQRVVPQEFLAEGFQFKFPTIESALSDLLKHTIKNEYVFKKYLWIEKPISEVFSFFSLETNLEKITPPYLKFHITHKSTEKISKGTLIDYKLKVHGVPLKWKTEITNFEKDKTFTDEQLKGPYKKWIHQHDFISYKNGTLMRDEVVYKVPMGTLGKIFAGSFIRNDVTNIFKYRNKIILTNFKDHI